METIKGYRVNIEQDDEPENPRDWDNLGCMTCWHNKYNLGDVRPEYEPEEFYAHLAHNLWECNESEYDRVVSAGDQKSYKDFCEKYSVVRPIYMQDHGQVSFSINKTYCCDWDSGQVGYIWAGNEDVDRCVGHDLQLNLELEFSKFDSLTKYPRRNEVGPSPYYRPYEKKLEAVDKVFSSELDVYEDYINGYVYGYTVYDIEGTIVDQCFGIYGEEQAMKDARDSVDHLMNKLN